jgi:transcription termination factor Rho
LADKRIFPAVDIGPSGTRRDELLIPDGERVAIHRLRRVLAGLDPQQALELLIDQTSGTASNLDFLQQIHDRVPSAARRDTPSTAQRPDKRKTA